MKIKKILKLIDELTVKLGKAKSISEVNIIERKIDVYRVVISVKQDIAEGSE